jgi:hypothetical protein
LPNYTTYKTFAILLNERLSDMIGKKSEECQMGFCPNRFTNDNIFIITVMFEMLWI